MSTGITCSVFRKFVYDTRLSPKLFYVILVKVVLPMACLGILCCQSLANVINEEIGSSYEQIVKQYTDDITYKLTTYHLVHYWLNKLTDVYVDGLEKYLKAVGRYP